MELFLRSSTTKQCIPTGLPIVVDDMHGVLVSNEPLPAPTLTKSILINNFHPYVGQGTPGATLAAAAVHPSDARRPASAATSPAERMPTSEAHAWLAAYHGKEGVGEVKVSFDAEDLTIKVTKRNNRACRSVLC